MYDRKTWIVVAACVVLLAVNLYFMSTQKAEMKARQDIEDANKPPEAKAAAAADGTPATTPKPAELEAVTPQPQEAEVVVTLDTPTAVFSLTSYGGGIRTVEIKGQTGVLGPVKMNQHGASPIGALAPNSDTFEGTTYEFVEAESVSGKKVVFRGKLDTGVIVTKTWSLVESGTGSGFQLDFVLELKNATDKPAPLEKYSLFLGAAAPVGQNEKGDGTQLIYHDGGALKTVGANSFAGGWFSKEKIIDTETVGKLEYAGVADQFFASVLRPVEPYTSLVWSKVGDLKLGEKDFKSIRAGISLPKVEIPAGESRSYTYRLFTGPKENRTLQKMENEQGVAWGDIMNYGWWSPFSRFMNRSLIWIHSLIEGSTGKAAWGLAVILLTIVIRTVIWPLYNRSNRTAKRMSKLKPEMDKLREKYPDDPTKVSQETMALYKKYGINPLGSCLPMFAQLPIFMGFFAMLNHAVEMRGSGFLWIKDLAEPDTFGHLLGYPINVLPILMGITSMIQMAMMPSTGGDKTQATMMKLMPIMFVVICYNSPAALALYWTTSNLFSITQTWLSNRLPEPELKPVKSNGKKGFMERMAEQAEAQKKMRQASGRVVEPGDDQPKKRPPRTGG
ncbi:MAG: rane protein insertase YidC [Akkermansiaceae bacterium]|nr:rane protein insertase YidC [Akkermansiaceae bacterium]